MTTSREFLELVLSGEVVTAAHLDALITERVREDENIEYKSGTLLRDKDRKERARIVREYMSGFANSDGGVLLFGIEEEGVEEKRPTQVAGCNPKDVNGDLVGWAMRCVTPIGAYFSPFPKFRVVEHHNGKVLVCAVGRSYNLVPVVEGGKLVHYFRLGEQTLPAPDYMVADLKLGRRARPKLEVTSVYLANLEREMSRENSLQHFLQFELALEVENSGLVWAEGSQYGLIVIKAFESTELPRKIPASLREYIDLQAFKFQEGDTWIHGMPQVFRGGSKLERPFDSGAIEHSVRVPLSLYGKVHSYIWRAALYLVARDSPPVWYQIDLRINPILNGLLKPARQSLGRLPDVWEGLSLTKLADARPIVGWTLLPTEETGGRVD